MTMGYVEGKPLSDYIDPKKPLPVKAALAMAVKIAAALDYAHKKGIIDPAVDAICQKALAKCPQDRYASMADFAKAITAYLKNQSSPGSTLLAPGEPGRSSAETPLLAATILAASSESTAIGAGKVAPAASSKRFLYPRLERADLSAPRLRLPTLQDLRLIALDVRKGRGIPRPFTRSRKSCRTNCSGS